MLNCSIHGSTTVPTHMRDFKAVGEILVDDFAKDQDFDGYIQTPPLSLDPYNWMYCRTSEEADGNRTLYIRSIADVHVTDRAEIAQSGQVASVPIRLSFGTPPPLLEAGNLRNHLILEWQRCNETITPILECTS